MSLLGIDIGTSGCKATIIDREGVMQSQAYCEYYTLSPAEGLQEINPDVVFSSVCKVVCEAVVACGSDPVQGISASSFGEAVVALDRQGQAIGNSLLYIDKRGEEEAEYLKKRIGDERVLQIAGTKIQPMFSLCKIMWLKKHQPEQYNRTWKYLLYADYVLFRLGAEPHTDYSLATRTMAFDITSKTWSQEILDCAAIDRTKFAEPVQAGTAVGTIAAAVAADLGLPADVALVAGGHDQPCAALGAGVIRPGMAIDGLGTVECLAPAFNSPILNDAMANHAFACVPHVVKDLYVTYAFTFTSGSVLKWYRDTLGQPYKDAADKRGVNAYTLMIEDALADPSPSPLLLLPHFAGAATPYMDNGSRGALIGLTTRTSARDILKAILEGITFEIMVNQEKLADASIAIHDLRAVGGLARSDQFLQLKANMMGTKIASLVYAEAGTIGVAILAGTATGLYTGIEDAVQKLVRVKKVFEPDKQVYAEYQARFVAYKRIYPAVRPIFTASTLS
ncbi:MAG: FGGY-family carbohydrate kinase [Bacillota bacterium]|nr:FGGY-family carbohydrate kinase [Bacillota bacterium]